MSISTHVLDAATGTPATGVAVQLLARHAHLAGDWSPVAREVTDGDGRVSELGPLVTPVGTYRLVFDTGGYYRSRGVPTFYPEVVVTFQVSDATAHHHVPLLLSPFAYSTYRGS